MERTCPAAVVICFAEVEERHVAVVELRIVVAEEPPADDGELRESQPVRVVMLGWVGVQHWRSGRAVRRGLQLAPAIQLVYQAAGPAAVSPSWMNTRLATAGSDCRIEKLLAGSLQIYLQ
jgi:hypothetical protein